MYTVHLYFYSYVDILTNTGATQSLIGLIKMYLLISNPGFNFTNCIKDDSCSGLLSVEALRITWSSLLVWLVTFLVYTRLVIPHDHTHTHTALSL